MASCVSWMCSDCRWICALMICLNLSTGGACTKLHVMPSAASVSIVSIPALSLCNCCMLTCFYSHFFSLHVSFSNWLLHFRSSKQTSHLPLISFQLRWARMSCRHLQQREAKARPFRKVCPHLFHSFCLVDMHDTTKTNIHIRSLTAECVTVCVAGRRWCSGGIRFGAALRITLFF